MTWIGSPPCTRAPSADSWAEGGWRVHPDTPLTLNTMSHPAHRPCSRQCGRLGDLRRALPFCLVWLALTLAACTETPQLAPIPSDGTILAFGDSLTFGTGAATHQSYPARLQRLSGRRVINAGVPGEVSARGAERLPALLDRHQPDLLVLCHGGNDILRGLPEQEVRDNLAQMIDAARKRGVQVVLLGVPARSLLLDTAAFYEEVAQHHGVPLEDDVIAAVLGEKQLRADRIHPNAQGYRHIAEAVYGLLRERGALP